MDSLSEATLSSPTDPHYDDWKFLFLDQAWYTDPLNSQDIDANVHMGLDSMANQQDIQALEHHFTLGTAENSFTTAATVPCLLDNQCHNESIQQAEEQAKIIANSSATTTWGHITNIVPSITLGSEDATASKMHLGASLEEESHSQSPRETDPSSLKCNQPGFILTHSDESENQYRRKKTEDLGSLCSKRRSRRRRCAQRRSLNLITDDHGRAHIQDASEPNLLQYGSKKDSSGNTMPITCTSGNAPPDQHLAGRKMLAAGNAVVEMASLRSSRRQTVVRQTGSSALACIVSQMRCCSEMSIYMTRDFSTQW
jgi:hypothetical protein